MTWAMTLDFTPPSVNHAYFTDRRGRRLLSADTKRVMEFMTFTAAAQGFRPDIKALYGLKVRFTFPTWGSDLDSPVKLLLDAIFGARIDHRVVRLEVDKIVESGVSRTEVVWWKEERDG